MAFPTAPRNTKVELFVNSGWTDISNDVYARDGITITRGRRDETSRAEPSSCTMTLNNRSGNYSPRNPAGVYYGSLGRNTPIRVGIEMASDTFTRTVASGSWGTSDSGNTYTVDNAAASVSSNQGKLSAGSAGSFAAVALAGVNLLDVDVTAFGTIPFSLPTGASVIPLAIRLRRYSSSDYVYAYAQVDTAGAVTVGVSHATKGVITAAVPTGITFSSSAGVNIRAQVEGSTYRVKVWVGGTAEPYGWTTTGNSTVSMAAGQIGFQNRTFVGSTNTFPIVTSVDNVSVRVPRFFGEVSAWPPRWDNSGNDLYVPLEAAGIKRRLALQAPLRSPLRRFHDLLTSPPLNYWPGEDLAHSPQQIVPAVGTSSFVVDLGPPIELASYSDLVSSAPLFVTGTGVYANTGDGRWPQSSIVGATFLSGYGTGFTSTVRAFVNIPADTIDETLFSPFFADLVSVDVTGPLINLTVQYYQGGIVQVHSNGAAFDIPITFPDIRGRPMLVQLQIRDVGADCQWDLNITDAATLLSLHYGNTSTGTNYGEVLAINLDQGQVLAGVAYGHISLRTDRTFGSGTLDIISPLGGNPGETAGTRFSRLCSEEDVNWYYRGILTRSTLVGPQGAGAITSGVSNNASLIGQGATAQNLLDLLYECEDADRGILYEPKGDMGLEYRTRQDLYSQAATLTLDYSLGQVSPPLEPVDDDQRTENNIVVSQPNGQSAEAELTSGSMSTLDPSQGGVGHYDAQYTINTTTNALADLATFLLTLGTVNEPRFPAITVEVQNTNITKAGLESSILAVNIGDKIVINNPQTRVIPDQINQIVLGYTEFIRVFEHNVTFVTAPETPYRLAAVGATPAYKVDTTTSTLAASAATTDLTLSVANVNEPWTQDPTQMPIPIVIDGEAMNVTAVSGTTSPQTFTVTRSTNGVVKSHSSGASVTLTRQRRPFVAY